MTKMKKVLGMVMAALMCFALTPMAAFGAGETGTITIKKAVQGETYSVYKVLDLTSYNAANDAYTYAIAGGWAPFFADGAPGSEYIKVDASGNVSWNGEDNAERAAAFAKAALDYANNPENGIVVAAKPQTPAKVDGSDGRAVVTFSNLPLGYYLVDSSLGALCSLNTTAPNAEITEKNDVPTIDKQVQEGDSWSTENDAAVGATVKFRTTVTGQPGAQNYVVHDKMTGLTFQEITSVTLNGNAVAASDYTLTAPAVDGCSFDLAFAQGFCDTIKANDKIVIEYSATVNVDAVVAGDGNPNETYLKYGDDSESVHKYTTTKTWKLPVFKYTGALGDNGVHVEATTPLEGAEFELTKPDDDDFATIKLKTDGTGYATASGLDAGIYQLTETKAPDGYNMLPGPQTIEITHDGKIVVNNEGSADEAAILNQAGSLLPSTGGIGTTILYVVGGILVIGAIIYLVRRRSHSA